MRGPNESDLARLGIVHADGRTTLSRETRALLGISAGGNIIFRRRGAGIVVEPADEDTLRDAALAPFLSLMEQDLVRDPNAVEPLARRLRHIIGRTAARDTPDSQIWRLYAHPAFATQAERVLGRPRPGVSRPKAQSQLLASLRLMMLDRIPANPHRPEFHYGAEGARAWFRARLADPRLHVFYRADRETRTIVYAWIADHRTPLVPFTAEPHVLFDKISTVSQDGRTLLPHAVRRFLGIDLGGRIAFHREGPHILVQGAPAIPRPPARHDLHPQPGFAPLGHQPARSIQPAQAAPAP